MLYLLVLWVKKSDILCSMRCPTSMQRALRSVNKLYTMEIELFVPGRLCILGEHTDWAAQYRTQNEKIPCGYTLVCATNEGLHARVSALDTAEIHFDHTRSGTADHAADIVSCKLPLDLDKLLEAAKNGGFFSYIAGTTAIVLQHEKYKLKQIPNCEQPAGLFINNYLTTLPMRKGLSSSAAVCVLVATAFSRLFNLDFSQEEIMEIAFQGEMLTPSRCGRMDQCVVMGPGAVGLMCFDAHHCTLRRLALHGPDPTLNALDGSKSGFYFVIVDLKASKNTVVILRELNECFPHPANDTQALIYKYVEGIVGIAEKSVAAVETADVCALGAQMTHAQHLFDAYCMPNCPSELTSPRLHALINDAVLNEMCVAVKGVGSQGDGSAQLLCRTPELQQKALAYVREKYAMDGFYLTIE